MGFIKKEWYNVRVPSNFDVSAPTLTPCNKAAGQKIPADSLRGRVFEISLGDLNRDSHESSWRKISVQCEEVKGYDCYTNFYGMDITRDKLCTLVKKWHSTIEMFAQAKTSDGYSLRMFCIAFTRRHKRQVKATCYAKNSQQKIIRQKMAEIMVAECQKSTLRELFKNFLSDEVPRKSLRTAPRFSHLRTCSSRRLRSSRNPSSISPNLWSSTSPTLRSLLRLIPRPPPTPSPSDLTESHTRGRT